MSRPTGVTIVAILYIISALVAIIGGALSFLAAGLLGGLLGGGLGLAAGLPSIIIGLICFIVAWGLLTLKEWARILAIVFAILLLILGLISLLNFPAGTITGVILVIVTLLILWYLFKPEVKSAFQ